MEPKGVDSVTNPSGKQPVRWSVRIVVITLACRACDRGSIPLRFAKMLITGYKGLSEDEVRAMSYDELVEAVLRMFKVYERPAENWFGPVYLPDELADAFRNRA